MSRLAKLIECIVERHKGVRRLALVWAMALITWAVVRTFGADTPNIGGATATALGIVIGIHDANITTDGNDFSLSVPATGFYEAS